MIKQVDLIELTSSFMLEDIKIDAKNNMVIKGQIETTIEPRLMRIIVKLAQESGQVVERPKLLEEISENAYVSDESLTQAISKIRQVFGDNTRQPKFIKTIPRKGYILLISPGQVPASNIETTPVAHLNNEITTKPHRWAQLDPKTLLIGLCLAVIIGVVLVLWWPESSPNEFIEKRDIEFIEKES